MNNPWWLLGSAVVIIFSGLFLITFLIFSARIADMLKSLISIVKEKSAKRLTADMLRFLFVDIYVYISLLFLLYMIIYGLQTGFNYDVWNFYVDNTSISFFTGVPVGSYVNLETFVFEFLVPLIMVQYLVYGLIVQLIATFHNLTGGA